jgi:outer membrane autotransporter protein
MWFLRRCTCLVFIAGISTLAVDADAAALRIDPCAPVPEVPSVVGGTLADCDKTETPVGVSQPGATNATLGGTASTIGSTIGGVVGGAFGGSGGGSTAAAGISRYALGGQTGQAAAAGAPRWNLWAAYSYVDVGYSFQPLQSGGHANLVLGGIDYMISNNLIAGVAVTDERTRIDTPFNGGKISGNGNTVAPYLGWRINRDWTLDASLGFGDTRLSTTDNSVAGGITGSNKVSRTMGTLGLAYNQAMGRWLLTGKGSLLAVENRFSSFTLSNNTFVNGSTVRTTQARLGGQAAYNAGNIVPFFGLTYIYDLERTEQAAIGGQSAANDRDGWQIRAGLNIRSAGALYGGIVLSSEVGRSQVKNDQLLVNVGVRF